MTKGGTMEDVGWYSESLRELFFQPTKESFFNLLELKKNGYTNLSGYQVPAWKPLFIEYYDKCIQPDVEALAAFSVKKICPDFFNDMSGLTTNASEGLNYVFKDVQDHKELPLDCVVLSFLQLSIYYCNEIKKGLGNTGEFRLRNEYREYFIDSKYVELRKAVAPSEIVKDLIADRKEFLRIAGVPVITTSESSNQSHSSQSEHGHSSQSELEDANASVFIYDEERDDSHLDMATQEIMAVRR